MSKQKPRKIVAPVQNMRCGKCKQLISHSQACMFSYHSFCVPPVVVKVISTRSLCACGRPKRNESFPVCSLCRENEKKREVSA